MTRKKLLLFLTAVFVFGLLSCHKGEISVSQTLVQPYIVCEDTEYKSEGLNETVDWSMGLSLYISATVPSEDGLQMVVTDSTGSLSWTFTPSVTTYEDSTYYGTSNISMPKGVLLPQGNWSLELLYKDGQTLSLSFEVSYGSIEDALSLNSTLSSSDKPFFDSISNLTIL